LVDRWCGETSINQGAINATLMRQTRLSEARAGLTAGAASTTQADYFFVDATFWLKQC
jgi:hypothetical protein